MHTLQSSRSSRLFLIELIIAVFFFSLGSAVCIQAFARAHSVSREARNLAFASSTVSGTANVLRFTGGDAGAFREYYPEAAADADGVLFACYREDFSPCGEDEAAYVLRAEARENGGVISSHIAMYGSDGELIYELRLRWPAGA